MVDLEYGKHALYRMHGRYASWNDINLALTIFESKTLIETWHTPEEEAKLIELTKGKLNCLIYNGVSKILWSIPAGFLDLSKLKEYVITINNGCPVVSKFRDIAAWPELIPCSMDKNIKLCLLGNDLKWYVIDKPSGAISWAPAGDDALQALEYLEKIPAEARALCIKNDFDIRIQLDSNFGYILSASIEKKPNTFENVVNYIPLGAGIIAVGVIAFNILTAIKGNGGRAIPMPNLAGYITVGGGHLDLAKNVLIGAGHLTNALNQSNMPTLLNSNLSLEECGFLQDLGRKFLGKMDDIQKQHIKTIKEYEKIEILDAKKNKFFFKNLKQHVKNKCYSRLKEYLQELQEIVDNFSKKKYEKLIFRVRAYVEKNVYI